MRKEIYGFQIIDNDHKRPDNEYMIYTIKKKIMTPASNDFRKGFGGTFSFEETIEILKHNKIKKLFTYHPNSEIVCAHPYEISDDEDFEMCKQDGKWDRFEHLGISLSGINCKILEKEGIKLIELNNKEISKLEKKLDFQKY